MASTLKIDTVTTPDGTGNITFNRPINAAQGGVGKILQVAQTHVTAISSQSVSANTITNITNLNVAITPSATSSKILVKVRWMGDGSNGDINDGMWGINRDSTAVGSPAAADSRVVGLAGICMGYTSNTDTASMDSAMYEYLDSPSTTSATTYHATFTIKTAQTMYNNQVRTDGDASHIERGTSTITVMEVSA